MAFGAWSMVSRSNLCGLRVLCGYHFTAEKSGLTAETAEGAEKKDAVRIPLTRMAGPVLLAGALALSGCDRRAHSPPLFELLAPDATGVGFVNRLPEDSSFNILNYLYYYNGGGVAAGDVNNDGLPDLYFTSKLGSNRLYLNKGSYRFEDVTDRAGVADPDGWKTGVTMADVDGDGWLDLYVSAVSYLTMHGHNVLYINNRDGTFTDRTREYGLEHEGYSTQALFFDYDGDGDLDMYLLNHSTHTDRTREYGLEHEGYSTQAL